MLKFIRTLKSPTFKSLQNLNYIFSSSKRRHPNATIKKKITIYSFASITPSLLTVRYYSNCAAWASLEWLFLSANLVGCLIHDRRWWEKIFKLNSKSIWCLKGLALGLIWVRRAATSKQLAYRLGILVVPKIFRWIRSTASLPVAAVDPGLYVDHRSTSRTRKQVCDVEGRGHELNVTIKYTSSIRRTWDFYLSYVSQPKLAFESWQPPIR